MSRLHYFKKLSLIAIFTLSSIALNSSANTFPYTDEHFYIGPSIGYGDTNWNMLTTTDFMLTVSLPSDAKDQGVAGGAIAGYQFNPYFAIQSSFLELPKTVISFLNDTAYTPIIGSDPTSINSYTHVFTLTAKFMLPIFINQIPGLRIYSNAGLAYVHRNDVLATKGRIGGAFGVGVLYNINNRIATQFSFDYDTGYGKSTLLPAQFYIPFVYDAQCAILIFI